MRINKYVARATGLSRRKADELVSSGQVYINEAKASLGDTVANEDRVYLNKELLKLRGSTTTIMLNKPVGYVCSRSGQGSKTIYELLPEQYKELKTIGRLDKDSSGLLLLTNDGDLANKLTHPKYAKEKMYLVNLDKNLRNEDAEKIKKGVRLDDGLSKFNIEHISDEENLKVKLSEGRNRQIRRTFAAIGYKVTFLHRVLMGEYSLGNLEIGKFKVVRE